MQLPTKNLEKKLLNSGYDYVIGVDEVGMGSLAGPVVVCAVIFNKNFFKKSHRELNGLCDSKLLSPKQREGFAERLTKEKEIKYALAYCFPKTIDKINIYQAARKAMKRTINRLVRVILTKDVRMTLTVLVDGPHKISGLKLNQIPIVKGDRKVFSIACASIIAKVYRDKMMIRYAKKYPGFGFEKHKGYGTKYHVAQLTARGGTKIHRYSFAPVSKLG